MTLLISLLAWVPIGANAGNVEDIEISVTDPGRFCEFRYDKDQLNKYCSFYGGLPYDRLSVGANFQALVTVANKDPLYRTETLNEQEKK